MQVRFTVPGRPVPAQRMTQRGKWSARARKSLDYQESVAWAAKAAGVPVLEGPVVLGVKIYVFGNRRGDLSNYVKAIEDGLQFAGVIPNDKQIVGYSAASIYQAEYPTKERVEIYLEEVPWWPEEGE